MNKIIIIGAGTSGLFCGALLSRNGYQVEVYEKLFDVGGRARCIEKDSFILDYGLHLIRCGEKGFITNLLNDLGENLDIISIKEPEIIYYENKNFHQFPEGRKFLLSDFVTNEDKHIMLDTVNSTDAVSKNMDKSVLEWLKEQNASEKLKKFMELASLGIICPFIEKASAGELFDVIKRRISLGNPKTGYPVGGFRTIHKKLINIILNNGGKIFINKEVKNIIVENNKIKGVHLDGKNKYCNIVICTLPPKEIFKIIDEKLVDTQKVNLLKNIIPTSGVSVDYCLSEKITEIENLIISVEDLNIIGVVTSNIDLSIAPKGKQLITFVAITSFEDIMDKNKSKEISYKLEEKIKEMFPRLNDYIEWKRIIYLSIIDGVELNIYQNRNRRPNPSFLGIEGLYLAGDYLCTEGAGGDLAVTSAKLCVDEIRNYEK